MSDIELKLNCIECPKCKNSYALYMHRKSIERNGMCDHCFREKEQVVDMVNHPPHYKDASGIECIEVTKYMSFLGGNCFKYLYRAGKKGSTVEDLKKAAWYAEQAWQMEEITDIRLVDNIIKIAEHRNVNIADAMYCIYEDMWADVKKIIEDEIARLESEASDD